MPEGHTVHRLAEAMRSTFAGLRVRVSSPQGRFAREAARIDGWVLGPAEAAGKHLLLPVAPSQAMDPELYVHVHLGLYGSWMFAAATQSHTLEAIGAPRKTDREPAQHSWAREPGPTVRLRIRADHALADLTGPQRCELITPLERIELLARLGPDPLREDARPRDFVQRIQASRRSIGLLLMDQSVVAGIGNIYRAELLFRARLDPYVPGASLSAPLVEHMWHDLEPLMRYGARTGAIVTTQPEHRRIHAVASGRAAPTYERGGDDPGAPAREESFYVYQRQGLPCRICDSPIMRAEMAGRRLYWCRTCQRARTRRSTWSVQHCSRTWA